MDTEHDLEQGHDVTDNSASESSAESPAVSSGGNDEQKEESSESSSVDKETEENVMEIETESSGESVSEAETVSEIETEFGTEVETGVLHETETETKTADSMQEMLDSYFEEPSEYAAETVVADFSVIEGHLENIDLRLEMICGVLLLFALVVSCKFFYRIFNMFF